MCKGNTFGLICHRNFRNSTQERKHLIEIASDKPFVKAAAAVSIFKNNQKLFPCNKKLFSEKYDTKIRTYALNELLGRPAPSMLNSNHLGIMLNEAKYGNFTRLDQILGFASTEKENEMIPIEQQLKMNSIMVNVLKAKGLDFDAIIAESAREKIQRSIQADENKRMEKQRKITKMKLNNQTKLGVVKSVPRKSDPIDDQEKRCKDARKIKTAKDHEHYRKSQRPTRI